MEPRDAWSIIELMEDESGLLGSFLDEADNVVPGEPGAKFVDGGMSMEEIRRIEQEVERLTYGFQKDIKEYIPHIVPAMKNLRLMCGSVRGSTAGGAVGRCATVAPLSIHPSR